jgi:hypothetical protein
MRTTAMRSQPFIGGALVLAVCAGRGGAAEKRVAQAFERLGAVVKRDDTKPNKPVIGLIFGLRDPIPETTPQFDKDGLFVDLWLKVTKVRGAPRKDGGKPLDPSSPTAVKVTDADLKDVSRLEQLQKLDLSYGEITDEALQYIKALKHLQTLDLRSTKVTGGGLVMLKELKSLKELYLTGCQVTDDGLVHLGELDNLEALYVGGMLGDVTDRGLRQLKKLRNLQKLHIWYRLRRATDEGLKELEGLTNLRELNLWRLFAYSCG